MTLRFTNSAILALTLLLTLTGLYGLVFALHGWAFEVHRWAGWALIALVPWKGLISLRSLRRGLGRTFDRSVGLLASLGLSALIIGVGSLGLLWMWQLGPAGFRLLGLQDTLISWHWMIGLALLPLFGLHSWRKWPRPKRAELLSRRGFLASAGLAAAGAFGWWGAGTLARATDIRPRRWTGSREEGSFLGNEFPVTAMVRDGSVPIDLASWRLRIDGLNSTPLSLSYEELLALPQSEQVATLDCTVGWFTTQRWSGVRLAHLLQAAGVVLPPRLIWLQAVAGYGHLFTPDEAEHILLATHVGGKALAHRHGFPMRAIVPSRRGWFWVKWLGQVKAVA